jgi:hypothetical protein
VWVIGRKRKTCNVLAVSDAHDGLGAEYLLLALLAEGPGPRGTRGDSQSDIRVWKNLDARETSKDAQNTRIHWQ